MKTSPSFDLRHNFSPHPSIGVMFFISVILHAVAITAMFFLPNLTSFRTFYSPVYSVRLVNIAPAPEPPAVEKPPMGGPQKEPSETVRVEPSKAAEKEKEPVKEPVKEKEREKEIEIPKEKPISLAPALKEKLTPKEQEDAERKIAEAIERIRLRKENKSVDETIERLRRERESRQVDSEIERLRREKEMKQLDSAIESLRSEKESRQVDSAIESIRKRVTIGGSGAIETSEVASGGTPSGVLSIKNKLYYNLIWQRIRNSWVFPVETLGGAKNLETIIAIRIAKDGQITDMQFEKTSGNSLLDESALRAIKKSNPLPPLPPGFEGDHFDVGIRFRPSELQG